MIFFQGFEIAFKINLNIFSMNENVNHFHSMLIHNIHVLHFLILVCICLYVLRFFVF